MDKIKLEAYYDAVQGGRDYMEDVINVRLWDAADGDEGYAFFGVFDGHGGCEAARFADRHLRREIDRQDRFRSEDDSCVVEAIKEGFVCTHNLMMTEVDSWPQTATGLQSTAGTTASVVIIRNSKMYVGHVGDSAVVIGKRFQKQFDGGLVAHCLTVDHKPDSVSERTRIERCGGEVIVKAGVSRVVWKRPRESLGFRRCSLMHTESIPFLAISRSLGDLWSYNQESECFVVSPEPDVTVHQLDMNIHRCIIIASDGIWNMISPSDAVEFVDHWLHQRHKLLSLGKDASYMKQPAAGLVKLALNRWQIRGMRADNISAIVVLLNSNENHNQPTVSAAAKCQDTYRPKQGIRRVRLERRRRRPGLRTVLGKLCRLRAQRNFISGVCVVRSPLGAWNRLSAAQQCRGLAAESDTSNEASMRRPLRRRSYQEACTKANNVDQLATQPRRLRGLVRQLSANIIRNREHRSDIVESASKDIDMDRSGVVDSDSTGIIGSDLVRGRIESSQKEITETDDKDDGPEVVGSIMEDSTCKGSDRRSLVDLLMVDNQILPTAVQCVTA